MITFDVLTLKAFIQEQEDFFNGARISKIQQPTRREFILTLRNKGETRPFYINISPEFYHIEDPSSGKPFSTRYFGIWSYTPVLKSKKRIYIVNGIISTLIAGIIGGLTALAIFVI